MTEMVTSGSMSGAEKRNDGLLGVGGNERRRQFQAPPGLHFRNQPEAPGQQQHRVQLHAGTSPNGKRAK